MYVRFAISRLVSLRIFSLFPTEVVKFTHAFLDTFAKINEPKSFCGVMNKQRYWRSKSRVFLTNSFWLASFENHIFFMKIFPSVKKKWKVHRSTIFERFFILHAFMLPAVARYTCESHFGVGATILLHPYTLVFFADFQWFRTQRENILMYRFQRCK